MVDGWKKTLLPVLQIDYPIVTSSHETNGCMLGIKPDIGHFRVFGSDGYAYVDESKRNKLQKKAYASLFLGYTNNSKGYSVHNKESG